MNRIPPHSIDAEQCVLGGLMLDPSRFDSIADTLQAEDFYRRDHQLIFAAIADLTVKGTPADCVTMGEWFDSQGLSEKVGGTRYIYELANVTPSAANITAYAKIVREKSDLRKLLDISCRLTESAFSGEGKPDGLADEAVGALMRLAAPKQRYEVSLKQAMTMAYAAMRKARDNNGMLPGINTGFSKLNQVLGGWHPADFIVVGARPSVGKTALLLNFLLSSGVGCGLISAEQPANQIGSRVMAIEARVDASRLRSGQTDDDDALRLSSAVQRLLERSVAIYDRSAPSIGEVIRVARKWKRDHGISLLCIDYIQRIQAGDPKAPRHERVGEVALQLKNLARDLEIPVIALAQVNRDVESREDKRPRMGDLANSSEIEKEADQIIMLYRDEVYNRESKDAGTAELLIEKNRHGPTGFVRVAWLAPFMKFADLEH